MAKFCTNCGAALDENKRFCGDCGHPVSVKPSPDAFAPFAPTEPPKKTSVLRKWWFWLLIVLIIAIAAAVVILIRFITPPSSNSSLNDSVSSDVSQPAAPDIETEYTPSLNEVLLDNEYATVVLNGYEYDNVERVFAIHLHQESKMNTGISYKDYTINGASFFPVLDGIDGPYQDGDFSLLFRADELLSCQIATVSDIAFTIAIVDPVSRSNIIAETPVHLFTSCPLEPITTLFPDANGVLLDNEYAKVTYRGCEYSVDPNYPDEGKDFYAFFQVENKTDTPFYFRGNFLAVNGMDPHHSAYVYGPSLNPGCRSIQAAKIFDYLLVENQITRVNTIELFLYTYSEDPSFRPSYYKVMLNTDFPIDRR